MRRESAVTIDCIRSRSERWTPARLQRLVDRPLSNPGLKRIEERRRELGAMPPLSLHTSYAGVNVHAGEEFVTARTISLPRRYGRILYSIAADLRPRCALEAGAGLGVSGMYLGLALALGRANSFISFEISEYSRIAQESISTVYSKAMVYQDDFDNFHRYLDPTDIVDFCFLDSKHDVDTILRNYKSLIGWLGPEGVLLIDDVMSTPGSRMAWDHICERDDFAFTACIHNRIGFLAR